MSTERKARMAKAGDKWTAKAGARLRKIFGNRIPVDLGHTGGPRR